MTCGGYRLCTYPWEFGGGQLPAVQVSVGMPGLLLWFREGIEGEQQARDQGALRGCMSRAVP